VNPEQITNPEAEWSVCAAMISDPSLIGEVVGSQLEAGDFVGADTRLLYGTAVELFYADQVVEPLTVAERCKRPLSKIWGIEEKEVARRVLSRFSEREYGKGVIEHAQITKRLSTARSLLTVANVAITSIAEGRITPEEVAGTMSAEALAVTSGSVARTELYDWMETGTEYARYLRRLRLAREKGVEMAVYTGLPFIDQYTKGIAPGELLFLGGDAGTGKALALDTPIPTPGGWTTMGQLEAGWRVLGSDGRSIVVQGVTEVLHGRPCYRVVFSDGTTIVADAQHEWLTSTHIDRQGGRPRLRTTEEIAGSLFRPDGGNNHRVEVCAPLVGEDIALMIDPWVLGLWLGDGNVKHGQISVGEGDWVETRGLLELHGYTVVETADKTAKRLTPEGLGRQLRQLGLLGRKRIPPEYRRASVKVRRELLAGLIDSDGHVNEAGRVEICSVHDDLASDIGELIVTLGLIQRTVRERATLDGRFAGWRYRITFVLPEPIALLGRKRCGKPQRDLYIGRFIRAVIPVPSVPVKCIEVRSSDSLYLAGHSMIPTHNSILGWKSSEGFAGRQMKKEADKRIATLIISMEMGVIPSATRLAQSITNVDGMRLREGDVSEPEYQKILREWKARDGLPIYFNYASNFRLSQLRALIVEAIRRFKVGFVVIDHFRQIDTDKPMRDPNDRDEEKVRFLKEAIAKDLNVAVMCLAHTIKVGRVTEGSGRPRLSDLRGSGTIANNADFVGLLHRPGRNLDEDEMSAMGISKMDAEIIWAKARHTEDGTAYLGIDPSNMTVWAR
jgi:replicative DNA helicase